MPDDPKLAEKIIAGETKDIARKFPREGRERGLNIVDMHVLALAYARRNPAQRSALLAALNMQPSEMAWCFQLDPERPFLEDGDLVAQLSGSRRIEELIEKNREIILDCVVTTHPSLWPKIVGTLEDPNNRIYTLGELADADPTLIRSRAGKKTLGLGRIQRGICATVLDTYGLLTKQWEPYLQNADDAK